MIYRMRIHQAVPENLPIFHEFFRAHLLPVQTAARRTPRRPLGDRGWPRRGRVGVRQPGHL